MDRHARPTQSSPFLDDAAAPAVAAAAGRGRRRLAADEALVLPWMMTCSSTIEDNGKMVRGFSLVALPKSDHSTAAR